MCYSCHNGYDQIHREYSKRLSGKEITERFLKVVSRNREQNQLKRLKET
jgi:hypothetical protein